jgi:hypothetical protein
VRKRAFLLLIASIAGALACSSNSNNARMPGVDAGGGAGTDAGAMGDPRDGASTPTGTDTGAPAAGNDAGETGADVSNGPGDSGGGDTALPDAGASDGGTDAGSCPPSSMSALINCDAALDDAGVHRVVLSGGFNAAGLLTDTWLWDGTGWTQQNISGPTPARPYAAAATLDGQIVLYGGLGAPTTTVVVNFLADTWLYDGKLWTQQNVSGPGGLWGAAAGALKSQVVMFGGSVPGGVSPGAPVLLTGNTWTWDGTRWTLQNVLGPSPRDYATAAAWNGKVVLFGGNGGTVAGLEGILSDTWIWDGAAWTQQNVSGPVGRISACAATLNGELVLFGGAPISGPSFGDTWVWDGTTWTQKSVSGPSARYACGAATLDGKVVLFGGTDATSGDLDDTWLWDGVSWTQANVMGPPAREDHVMSTL